MGKGVVEATVVTGKETNMIEHLGEEMAETTGILAPTKVLNQEEAAVEEAMTLEILAEIRMMIRTEIRNFGLEIGEVQGKT